MEAEQFAAEHSSNSRSPIDGYQVFTPTSSPDFVSAVRAGIAEFRRTRAQVAFEHLVYERFPITVDGITIVASMKPSHPFPSAELSAAVASHGDSFGNFYTVESLRLSGTSFPVVAKFGGNQQLVSNSWELQKFVEDMLSSPKFGSAIVAVLEQPYD